MQDDSGDLRCEVDCVPCPCPVLLEERTPQISAPFNQSNFFVYLIFYFSRVVILHSHVIDHILLNAVIFVNLKSPKKSIVSKILSHLSLALVLTDLVYT